MAKVFYFGEERETAVAKGGILKKPLFECTIDDYYTARRVKPSTDQNNLPNTKYFITTNITVTDYRTNASVSSVFYRLQFVPNDLVTVTQYLPTDRMMTIGQIEHTLEEKNTMGLNSLQREE